MTHADRIMVIAGHTRSPLLGAGSYSGIPRHNVSRLSSATGRNVENARQQIQGRGSSLVMTITRAGAVIIFAASAGAAGAADELASAGRLTTAVAPAAAALTTVVIDGSTVYDAPRLFGAYRGQLGK